MDSVDVELFDGTDEDSSEEKNVTEKCEKCGKVCADLRGLRIHQTRKHSRVSNVEVAEDKEKVYECDECDKCCENLGALGTHKYWKHNHKKVPARKTSSKKRSRGDDGPIGDNGPVGRDNGPVGDAKKTARTPKLWPSDTVTYCNSMVVFEKEPQKEYALPVVNSALSLFELHPDHVAFNPASVTNLGVMATKDIAPSAETPLLCYAAHIFPEDCGSKSRYVMTPDLGNSTEVFDAILKGNESRFINAHLNIRDEPNVKFGRAMKIADKIYTIPIYAVEHIKAGEELLLNYGPDYFDDNDNDDDCGGTNFAFSEKEVVEVAKCGDAFMMAMIDEIDRINKVVHVRPFPAGTLSQSFSVPFGAVRAAQGVTTHSRTEYNFADQVEIFYSMTWWPAIVTKRSDNNNEYAVIYKVHSRSDAVVLPVQLPVVVTLDMMRAPRPFGVTNITHIHIRVPRSDGARFHALFFEADILHYYKRANAWIVRASVDGFLYLVDESYIVEDVETLAKPTTNAKMLGGAADVSQSGDPHARMMPLYDLGGGAILYWIKKHNVLDIKNAYHICGPAACSIGDNDNNKSEQKKSDKLQKLFATVPAERTIDIDTLKIATNQPVEIIREEITTCVAKLKDASNTIENFYRLGSGLHALKKNVKEDNFFAWVYANVKGIETPFMQRQVKTSLEYFKLVCKFPLLAQVKMSVTYFRKRKLKILNILKQMPETEQAKWKGQ